MNPEPPFDSRPGTEEHIARVALLLGMFCGHMRIRADVHDQSKLEEPEKSAFDATIPKLKDLVYGSEEYRAALREMAPALAHHYAHNSHHPEHYDNGIHGMSLMDVVEMLCDWKAASERMAGGGDIARSIVVNQARFSIPVALCNIFANTAVEMEWLDASNRPQINPVMDFVREVKMASMIANDTAREKGFWEEEHKPERMLSLIQDELNEAKDALALGNPPDKHCPNFSSVEIELADVIIIILNISKQFKWDIGSAIAEKMNFNCTRPYKHGKES